MREGGLAIVSHAGFADPAVVEIIALAGFDGVFIDMEHTVFDLQLVGEMIRVADLSGITPVVRVPDNDAKLILRILDMGPRASRYPTSTASPAPNGPWPPCATRPWGSEGARAQPGLPATAPCLGWSTCGLPTTRFC